MPDEPAALSGSLLEEFSSFLSERVGLHFPRERHSELGAGLGEVSRQLGQPDTVTCIRWLMATPLAQGTIEALASQLTIGETYFFREPETFRAIEQRVLPELIRARARERRLRIWSAGCSTGEEAYSVAILLDRLGESIRGWDVTLLATDINSRFLRKAAEGCYGEWSFRSVAPEVKSSYFTRGPEHRYKLLARIRDRVTFACLNLAGGVYPSFLGGAASMDLILCRNVLMYLAPEAVARIVGQKTDALAEGGWLATGVAETLLVRNSGLQATPIGGATLFQKTATLALARGASQPDAGQGAAPARSRQVRAQSALDEPQKDAHRAGSRSEAQLARAHADGGNLEEALACSRRALAADKLDPTAHYVHALIEIEAGHAEEAARALRRATFLDRDFVMAHFALAGLALDRSRYRAARRHLDTVRRLLRSHSPHDRVPQADDMSAGQIARMLDSMQEDAHGGG